MMMDKDGWAAISEQLANRGWQGSADDLQSLVRKESEVTSIRHLFNHWSWGARAKALVAGVLAGSKNREGASVRIEQAFETGRIGPSISVFFPEGARLEAIRMQVEGPDRVYVVRRFDGDWRSCRTFQLSACGMPAE